MILQSVKMAWASVISNKMRSFLTMLGILPHDARHHHRRHGARRPRLDRGRRDK